MHLIKTLLTFKRHYKTSKRKAEKEPIETVRQVTEWYNKDSISWQLPYKNLTRIARDHHGNYHRVLIRVIKVALKKAFETFQNEKTQTSKLVEHLKIYDLSMLDSSVTPSVCSVAARIATIWITFRMWSTTFSWKMVSQFHILVHNDALISSGLCDFNSLQCIMRVCLTCKSLPKIDTLDIPSLKCSKSCVRENKNCSEHTNLVHQFDWVEYMHKGKEMKKLKLLDKMIKLKDLVTLFKTKLKKFPRHRLKL